MGTWGQCLALSWVKGGVCESHQVAWGAMMEFLGVPRVPPSSWGVTVCSVCTFHSLSYVTTCLVEN